MTGKKGIEQSSITQEEISLFNDKEYVTERTHYELQETVEAKELIKSKVRVQSHGEVFTPKWMVQKMLAEPTIQEKICDLHATFLEPSAGEGAFLREIVHQRLTYVDQSSTKSTWISKALWALMSIYGIELLPDNLIKARAAMMGVVINHYQTVMQKQLSSNTDFYKAAHYVIATNIVQGNTLEYTNNQGQLIEFSHWWPVDDKKVQREVFTYKSLFADENMDETVGQLDLFDELLVPEPTREYQICDVTKVYKGELK